MTRDAFTMRFRPEVGAFVKAQASAGNRRVTNFVETLLLREKACFEESQPQLTVHAAAELLRHERHDLVRDTDEADVDYAARRDVFDALIRCSTHKIHSTDQGWIAGTMQSYGLSGSLFK
ncbi:hypothetical protein [Lichenicoccus sp.]|uniref:hypothetical protein n=1 Tax=Lichenicoccus sp. TaxID=2781899 RepID=UPI003D0B0814